MRRNGPDFFPTFASALQMVEQRFPSLSEHEARTMAKKWILGRNRKSEVFSSRGYEEGSIRR